MIDTPTMPMTDILSTNPFDTDDAVRHSRYYGMKAGRPVLLADPAAPPDLLDAAIAGAFRGFVQASQFSCLGAKSAVGHENYRVGVYEPLGSPDATAGLARDLWTFAHEAGAFPDHEFRTFAAVFRGPMELDEADFERLLWAQLRGLHRHDAPLHDWDPLVSSDPADPHFSFSFAASAFFVVGLHPHSSRQARRFPWPMLVFNPHAQFMKLKDEGRFERLQEIIRTREHQLQGSLNPNLADYGTATEARQYSGRSVEPGWHAPFGPVTETAAPEPVRGGCPFGHGRAAGS